MHLEIIMNNAAPVILLNFQKALDDIMLCGKKMENVHELLKKYKNA